MSEQRVNKQSHVYVDYQSINQSLEMFHVVIKKTWNL